MKPILLGPREARYCLIQPVDAMDAERLESEYAIGFLPKTSDAASMLDVIRLSGKGLEYKEIAGQLGIKYLTVVTIKNNIFRKLGINNTVELVIYAVKKDLISL